MAPLRLRLGKPARDEAYEDMISRMDAISPGTATLYAREVGRLVRCSDR